jgi:hypothetical protein
MIHCGFNMAMQSHAKTIELILGSNLLVKVPQCRNLGVWHNSSLDADTFLINRVQALTFTSVSNIVSLGQFWVTSCIRRTKDFPPPKKGPKLPYFKENNWNLHIFAMNWRMLSKHTRNSVSFSGEFSYLLMGDFSFNRTCIWISQTQPWVIFPNINCNFPPEYLKDNRVIFSCPKFQFSTLNLSNPSKGFLSLEQKRQ